MVAHVVTAIHFDHRVVAAAFPLPGGRLRAAIRLPSLGRCSIGAAPAPLMDRRGLTRDAGEQRAAAALTALDLAADVGPIATAFVAFAGAALLIIAQRKFWHAHA